MSYCLSADSSKIYIIIRTSPLCIMIITILIENNIIRSNHYVLSRAQ